jgi:phage tail-like protein
VARPRIDDVLTAYHFWLADISPSVRFPFTAFTPVLGFQSITMPEATIDVDEFIEGNYQWKRKAIGKAGVGAITLTRGARFFDGDFWRWFDQAVRGHGKPRRNLLLLQTMAGGPGVPSVPVGPFELLTQIPARAWILYGCLPTGYKPGSDFDATASEISMMELTVDPERVEEISLGGIV